MTEVKKMKKSARDTMTHAKNAAVVAKGTAKSATGKAVGNRKLRAKGELEKVKGKAKQAGQRVKESMSD